jgi:hypothetical protein
VKTIVGFLTLISIVASAHSGRTNASGCHNDRKNGGYHCHRSEASDQKLAAEKESEGLLVATEKGDKQLRDVAEEEGDYTVMFNTKSHKYHRPRCKSAKACTVNCIELKKSEAIERHGIPCGNCGG